MFSREIMSLCRHCNAIDFTTLERDKQNPHHRTFRELKQSATSCPLCALFVEGLEKGYRQYDYDKTAESVHGGISYTGLHQRNSRTYSKDLIGLSMICQGGFSAGFSTVNTYASEDSAAATSQDVLGKPIGPAEDFGVSKRWLQQCLENHDRCAARALNPQNPSIKSDWIPKRVVDVGPIDGSREPRLICDARELGQYVTLSHCWGDALIVQTTTETLSAHRKQIPLAGLTKTFRDAVIITRNLGFWYLWIDSLCIIQDDPKDWETESALMADIYGNSTVTIAASSSENGRVGCFFPRDSPLPIALNYPSKTRSVGYAYVRRPLKNFEETVDRGPLNSRAWVFQERLLSRRILHYGKDQLHWECQETCLSEDGRKAFGHDYDKASSILSSAVVSQVDKMTLYEDWCELVEQYTYRYLTKESDKFPALSGLANRFAGLSGDRYVAGHWESDLMVSLLWHASDIFRRPLNRPSAYRAPSWSWAALDGPISFDSEVSHNRKDKVAARATFALSDLDIAIQLAGSDPFGMVASGTLTVSGRLRQVEYQIVSKRIENNQVPSMYDTLYSNGEKIGQALFDEAGTHGPLYRLDVCTTYDTNDERNTSTQLGLVLKLIGADERFCRVGMAMLDPFVLAKRNDWFYDVPTRRIAII